MPIAAIKKPKMRNLKKRKACITKKTMELSVLCDIEACVIMVDDDGSVETWPKNQRDVIKIINKYNTYAGDNNNVKKKKSDGLGELLRMVETKLEALDRRIEVVKNHPIDNHKGKDKMTIKDAEQGFLSVQTFHQASCEQDSLNQEQLTSDQHVFNSSASTSEQGFLSVQTFHQTHCEQESSNQQQLTSYQHVFDNINQSASYEQRFLNYYIQPAILQTPFVSGQESNHQIMYYLPVGLYQLPLHHFTANGLFPGRLSM